MGNSTRARFQRIQEFLDETQLAGKDQAKLPMWQRAVHFWFLVGKSFVRNRGPVRASALAYTTLLALIPVLALFVGLSTALLADQGREEIDKFIDKAVTTMAPQLGLTQAVDEEEAAISRQIVVKRITDFIENMNSGKLGVTAGLMLVFVGISLLSTIEATFNDIWGVIHGRSWSARIIQYWAALSLGPILLVTALGLTASSQFDATWTRFANTPFIGGLILKGVPFAVLTILFTVFYKMMPATRVLWIAALVGGALAAFLVQLNSASSVIYMSKVVSYSKVYGSIGVIPIFLIGLYFSWLIVLFGAQVAYAYQNRLAYLQERQAESVNQQGREFVALRIMTFIAQRFEAAEKPPSRLEMSKALGVPSQLAAQILVTLVKTGLVMETLGEETGYGPGRPVEKISVEDVLCAMRVGQGQELATADDSARAIVREQYERVLLAEMQAANAINLRALAARVAAAPQALKEPDKTSPV